MKILFDQGAPAPLRRYLPGHTVVTAYELGWSTLQNGDLIRAAESEGFEIFVTTDRNLKYQQNLKNRKMAIFVLLSTNWPDIRVKANQIAEKISFLQAASYVEFDI